MNRQKIINSIRDGKDNIDKAEDIILSNEEMVMKMVSIIRDGDHQRQTPEEVVDNIFQLLENPSMEVNDISMRIITDAYMKRNNCRGSSENTYKHVNVQDIHM